MRVFVLLCAAATFVVAPFSTSTRDRNATLTVHEWGTFTSVAGPDGTAVEWLPQAGPTDLPCFVERNRFNIKGSLSGTVRMETPVLYFYTDRELTVNVRVRFREGAITEWFPRAVVSPGVGGILPNAESSIAWHNVKVMPGAAEDFPIEDGGSHYYAARRTGAAPLQSGSAKEKFLFYRGVGRFAPPIAATVDADGNVSVRNPRGQSPGEMILFDNHQGRIVYEMRNVVNGQVIVDPVVTDREPTQELEGMLLANGLYPEEASAMIDTWRDSWFEEGTRLIYIVPRSAIETILPLEISPTPTAIERVFVGRMELVTPATSHAVKEALLANDAAALRPYGRFLQAIGRRLVTESAPGDRPTLERRLQRASAAWFWPQDECKRE